MNGIPKEELYIRARDWFSNHLQSLQIQDKETGELSGKGAAGGVVKFRILGSHSANAVFNYNANIWIQDGRYIYNITNINNVSITYNNTTSTTRDDISSPAGMLYTSEHSRIRVLSLSQSKSDQTYQSANAFNEIARELIASLTSDMAKKSTPDF